MLVISLILAASGILTCGLALSDIFLPRGSAVFVLASIPVLGVIILGVLVTFAWTCELFDRRGGLRIQGERLAGRKTVAGPQSPRAESDLR